MKKGERALALFADGVWYDVEVTGAPRAMGVPIYWRAGPMDGREALVERTALRARRAQQPEEEEDPGVVIARLSGEPAPSELRRLARLHAATVASGRRPAPSASVRRYWHRVYEEAFDGCIAELTEMSQGERKKAISGINSAARKEETKEDTTMAKASPKVRGRGGARLGKGTILELKPEADNPHRQGTKAFSEFTRLKSLMTKHGSVTLEQATQAGIRTGTIALYLRNLGIVSATAPPPAEA